MSLFTSKTTPPRYYACAHKRGRGESLTKGSWLHTQRQDDGQHYFTVGSRFNMAYIYT